MSLQHRWNVSFTAAAIGAWVVVLTAAVVVLLPLHFVSKTWRDH